MRAPARANVALIGWSVDSAATVKLITHAVGATTRDKTLGRAEALRRAMLTMIDKDEPREGHQPSGRRLWWWVRAARRSMLLNPR